MGTVSGSALGGLVGAGLGMTKGAAIGVVFGPVGAMVGGFVGGVVGGMAGSTIGDALYAGGKVLVKTAATMLKTLNDGLKEAATTVCSEVESSELVCGLSNWPGCEECLRRVLERHERASTLPKTWVHQKIKMGCKMKMIKFDLPIDGVKVKSVEELRDHFKSEILNHCNYSGCKRRAKDFERIATIEPTGLPHRAQDAERLGPGLRAGSRRRP
ncbi:MAG: hypothetical protein MZV65_19565 [Chromatiales bacterium]|nr:hypothetical protein [Chromatiales bacterium]